MMRTVGFLLAILCLGLIYHHSMAADECGCGVRHPQVRFCESSVAMIVQVHDKVESNLPFTTEKFYKDHMKFNVTILEVFKPKDIEEELLQEEFTSLWTPSSFCGVPELPIIEAYVISGYFRQLTDPTTGDEFPILMMTRCGIHAKLDDVTPYQMTGFKGLYQEQCDDCRPADIFGELVHNRPSDLEFELFPEAMTKFWTLDMECFYNPAASMHNLVRDCESEVSTCKRDPNTAKCAWDMNNDFMSCYKQRGRSVSYRHNPNSAAVRKPSDCKYLQSKKLKKKCLRNIRKKLRDRKKQNRRNSQS